MKDIWIPLNKNPCNTKATEIYIMLFTLGYRVFTPVLTYKTHWCLKLEWNVAVQVKITERWYRFKLRFTLHVVRLPIWRRFLILINFYKIILLFHEIIIKELNSIIYTKLSLYIWWVHYITSSIKNIFTLATWQPVIVDILNKYLN